MVSAVLVDGEDLLLVRRGRPPCAGTWAPPGGRVEWGESVVEAVVRELAEETGLEGTCGELMGVSEVQSEGFHAVILAHRAHLWERAEPRAGDDAAEARWVPLHEVVDLALAPGVAELLHDHGLITTFT